MLEIVFGTALLAVTIVIGLLISALISRTFEFWPPPNPSSWQSRTLRILFRVFFYSLIVVSVLDFDTTQPTWRYIIGVLLTLFGFGCALRWTNFLGWGNAFGTSEGLTTSGIYQFSRNPIYVISIVGMVGWSMLVGSWMANALLALWAGLYIVAPFLEESWLKKQYGEAFTRYQAQVPRFGSARSIAKHLIAQVELKIPPLVIILICAGLMYLCSITITHTVTVPIETRAALSIVLAIVAVGVLTAALMTFQRHRTTINPLNPNNTTTLVTTGVYAHTRNPMYLAMLIVLLGWGFLLGQISTIFGVILFVVAITGLQIQPEERVLKQSFGSAYTDYLTSSHRWFGFRHQSR